MRIKKMTVAAFAALAVSLTVSAGDTDTFLKQLVPNSGAITPGKWHTNFTKAKKYAEDNKVPFIAVWSNGDACPHCVRWENSARNATFTNWMKTSGIVFWFGCPSNGYKIDSPKDPFQWTRAGDGYRTSKTVGKNLTSFPFIRVYWPDGSVDVAVSGDDTRGGYGTSQGATSAKKMVSYFSGKLKGWSPAPAVQPYKGGEFDSSIAGVDGARLEVETGLTTNLTVYLTRTNSTTRVYEGTNYVSVAGLSSPVQVLWESGESEKSVSIPVDKNGTGNVAVKLLDADASTVKETLTVARVAAQENSPDNPLFVGEESANLDFGQWSMDLDAVTNLVAKTNAGAAARTSGSAGLSAAAPDKAYALVLFGGAMWCPDCTRSDVYFFEKDVFKNWAKERRIALGVVDIPNLPNTTNSPSLLTRICAATGAGTVKGKAQMSGAGYLSRHMVSDEAATAVFERNCFLASHNVLDGGWNRPLPERSNQNRPGVPIVLLLREDGSIAGRFTELANASPVDESNNAAYIERLEELLEQDLDVLEESNDGVKTTTETLGKRQTLGLQNPDPDDFKALSSNDAQDVYELDAETAGAKLRLSLAQVAANPVDASIALSVVNTNGTAIASTKGNLADGIVLEAEIPADGGRYCAVVAQGTSATITEYNGMQYTTYSVDSEIFKAVHSGPSIVPYSISSDFILVPEEGFRTATGLEGGKVLVQFTEGETYFFGDGVDLAANAGILEAAGENASGKPLYKALETGCLELAISGTELSYQLWRPGEIAFAYPSATVSESVGVYAIPVVREGGSSGTARFSVDFAKAMQSGKECDLAIDTLAKPNGWTFGEGVELEWADGESGAKTVSVSIIDNQFADGSVALAFTGVKTGGDAAAATDDDRDYASFILNVKDNDRKVPGKLAIVETETTFMKTLTIAAKESTCVKFGVKRQGGADGDFSAALSTTAGTLDATELAWESRNDDLEEVSLTLPARSVAKKCVVTLSAADSSTKLDTKAKKLVVEVLPEGVPEFETLAESIDAFRYVPAPEKRVKVKEGTFDDLSKLSVKKVSGALPAGMTASLDNTSGELVLKGVPSKKTVSTAVYRIYEGSEAGTTVAVTVAVTDPAVDTVYAADASSGTKRPVAANAYLLSSHTYSDVMVLDSANHLRGLLTLSVPSTGKASAKYRSIDGTFSMSSKNWDSFDPATGALAATLEGVGSAAAGYRVDVAVDGDGEISVELADPAAEAEGVELSFLRSGIAWSKAAPADDYKGYYTASLPGAGSADANKNATRTLEGDPIAAGDGYLTLRMTAATALAQGKFAYAGLLPDGNGISGSATVAALPHEAATNETHTYWGALPLMSVSKSGLFAGALKLRPKTADASLSSGAIVEGGSYTGCREGEYCGYTTIRRSIYAFEGAVPLWRRIEPKNAAAEYAVELDVFGGIYDPAENFAQTVEATFETAKLSFFAMGDKLGETQYGSFAGWSAESTGVTVGTTLNAKKTAVAANTIATNAKTPGYGLTVSFDQTTGVLSGKVKLPMEDGLVWAVWKAVAMPGFGDGQCDCGFGGSDAKNRPFISGTAWFDDAETFTYPVMDGRKTKAVKVRRSCPVSAGKTAGE